jgi:hypothetical protein
MLVRIQSGAPLNNELRQNNRIETIRALPAARLRAGFKTEGETK